MTKKCRHKKTILMENRIHEEAMSKKPSKYTGWGMTYSLFGQLTIIIVPAKNKNEAVEMLEALQLPVKDEKHIRHVSVYKYPGPKAKELDWDEMMRPIEDV